MDNWISTYIENPEEIPWESSSWLKVKLLQEKIVEWLNHIQVEYTWYGRNRMKSENIKEAHNWISNDFLDFFQERAYKKIEAVGINSWIDDSVYFIWAGISVLKPFLISRTIPSPGLTIIQPSLRTRNSKTILNHNIHHNWGSLFEWAVTLVDFANREKLLAESIELLLVKFKIPIETIRINISSQDDDLVSLLSKINCPIELVFDSKPLVYYRHKYWLRSIVWRNFNFSLKEISTWEFRDIWNYIIIEDDQEKYWVELALGVSVIMKELYELSHVLESSLIDSIFPGLWNPIRQKFQDSIISSIAILQSWVKPNSSNTKWRILKAYLQWIKVNADFLKIDQENIYRIISEYEKLEYTDNRHSDFIINYIYQK